MTADTSAVPADVHVRTSHEKLPRGHRRATGGCHVATDEPWEAATRP